MILVDAEFQNLIPTLTQEEFSQLKENILSEGVRDPLVCWRNGALTLLDGHNRYRICTENNIHFNVVERDFENREEAKTWIIKNQFGRRNLNKYQRSVLALQLEDIFKKKAKQNQGSRTDISPTLAKSLDTREEIAKSVNVSHGTLDKVKVIEKNATGEQKEKLRSGEESVNKVYNEVKRAEKKEERRQRYENVNQVEFSEKKYRVIYCDPPWRYNDSGVITENDNYGRAERHYPTMSLSELRELSIKEIADDNAILFMWSTSPMLESAFILVESWGFRYKTSFIWDKIKHNFGHYNSVRHELLLVCTRGSCTPDNLKLFDSVQQIERTRVHSEKPEEFRKIIETLYTWGNKIELFARKRTSGWDVWGNQSEMTNS
ncbi:ParB N-terminal domain-containing protein [candidate division KSB1 bacterium]|nr:ParB N-terminal domain-containing protein [candidate division KSB1 bacterium]